MATLDQAIEDIVQDLETNYGREVHSREIGAKVMQKLHVIDGVAYVRYASVYRHFQDIGEFIDEIKMLENKPKPNNLQQELFK